MGGTEGEGEGGTAGEGEGGTAEVGEGEEEATGEGGEGGHLRKATVFTGNGNSDVGVWIVGCVDVDRQLCGYSCTISRHVVLMWTDRCAGTVAPLAGMLC